MDTTRTTRRSRQNSAYPKRVSLYETEAGLALLKDLARRRGVSTSDLLRRLIREEADRAGLPAEAEPSAPGATGEREGSAPLWERLAASMRALPEEALATLPEDLAEQHDHYLYGTPKR